MCMLCSSRQSQSQRSAKPSCDAEDGVKVICILMIVVVFSGSVHAHMYAHACVTICVCVYVCTISIRVIVLACVSVLMSVCMFDPGTRAKTFSPDKVSGPDILFAK